MNDKKHIHLIGICGTAMASLAGMLRHRGFQVTGSDAAAYPPMSDFLRELGIPVEQIRASGGGSRSPFWRQIQADIYGKELVTLRTSEGSALGAALLAGVGGKIYSSVEESAQEAIQVQESMAPKPENVATYDRYYQVYRNLYPAVKEFSHTLARL